MASWNGRQFGKYIIHEEAGRGGMARVFRATDTALQRPVALKILAPQLASDAESSKRFEREAITAANLRHPNIVTIFDVGEVEGVPYIAMEYIAGRTLQAVIDERGALGLGYAVALLAPVAEALDYAHQQNAVHRDIKPHNIMINADGRVVLTDFGIAQVPAAGGQRLTRSGMFMGTPEYIAPEQASAQPVDGRSDLYSLGIVAFEVMTGTVPFTGSVPELLVAHAYTPPPSVATVVSGLPAALDKIFARALAKNPDARPPSAIALIDALRTICIRTGGILPARGDLAELATPRGSSAGRETMALAAASQLPPLQPPRQTDPAAATDVGAVTPPRAKVPTAQPVPRPAQPPKQPSEPRSIGVPAQPAPRQRAANRPASRSGDPAVVRPSTRARPQVRRSVTTSDPVKTAFPFVFALLLVTLGIVFWQRSGGNKLNIPDDPGLPPSNGGLSGPFVPETRIPTFIPPTDTPAPTAAPSEVPTIETSPTPEPPTETTPPNDPTRTPRPTRTLRPAATAVPLPTDVPLPPTDVPLPPTEIILPTITPPLPTPEVTTVIQPSPPTVITPAPSDLPTSTSIIIEPTSTP